MTQNTLRVWALGGGTLGMAHQLQGLTEVLGLAAVSKTASLRSLWRWLPTNWVHGPVGLLTPHALTLRPPYPHILFSCGRHAAVVSRALQRHNPGPMFRVHLQDPHLPARHFDRIICGSHDTLRGPNVLVMDGALNSVTPQRLGTLEKSAHALFHASARPVVGVLLGGETNRYRFDACTHQTILQTLQSLRELPLTCVIVSSPRTPESLKASISQQLATHPQQVLFYDGTGPNPYWETLAGADLLVVTNDSVNMMSEACATQKPVFILELPGHHHAPPTRFADILYSRHQARPFKLPLNPWVPPPFWETQKIADQLRPALETFVAQNFPHLLGEEGDF